MDDLNRLKNAYQAAKRQKQLLDYDDLLVMLRQLLLMDESARATISRLYRYILVDEYQDTNRLQAEVVRKLAASHNNVMVVGDDSQSIYAFRGATFKNIMDFPQLFPGTQIYKLEENYRSTQPILNLANCIIEKRRRSTRSGCSRGRSTGRSLAGRGGGGECAVAIYRTENSGVARGGCAAE